MNQDDRHTTTDPIWQQLENRIKKFPDAQLKPGFEHRVMQRVSESKSAWSETIWLWLGVTSMIVAAVVAAVLSGFKPGFGAFAFLSGNTGLVVFGAGFVAFLLWVERKLLPAHTR